MSKRLYILDAHSLIYQVFHAIPEMSAPDGTPTNAVFGFVRDILYILKEKAPDYLVCAFDAPGDTFRHEIYAEYKANRPEMPQDLRPQIGLIREILQAFRVPVLSQPGFEADDYLASVAARCRDEGIEAFLCTADKDMRQVVGPKVKLLDLRRGRVIDEDYVRKDWGIEPSQVVDYQSLVGDSTDNVPGVRGIGPKTAAELLRRHKTLEGIYENVDLAPGKKVRENLLAGKRLAFISRDLVRLKQDVPLPASFDEWKPQSPDRARLLELFARCGFHRFADEVRASAPAAQAEWVATYTPVTDEAGLDALLMRFARAGRLSVDLETTSIHPSRADIVGYSLCDKPGEAFFVSVRAPEGESSLDPAKTLEKLRPLLENPEIEKVGQNLKYDMICLRGAGVSLAGPITDTMVASYLLEPGERNHGLDELSLRLLGHETIKITELIGPAGKNKTQKRMDEVPVGKIAEYAGEDADVALRLADLLMPRLAKNGLDELYREVEGPLVEVLAEMEYHGIRVDSGLLDDLGRTMASQLEGLEQEIHSLAGEPFNQDSPAQLRVILFEKLKLPVIKRTPSGPSTDQEVLEELAERHPLCEKILEYRRLAKLKGTYIDALPALINPRTGRIHASFNQTVAATGRLSSSDPNLQNIPVRSEDGQRIRRAFLPRDDEHVLISADYSQIELRLVAYYSGDEALRTAFIEGRDIHAVVAAQIENVPLDQVTEGMRRRAKAVNFGIMYGLSPFGLARQLKIDKEEAATFIDAYFAQYPRIEAFFTEVLESALRNGYVSTILGRRRPISGVKNTTGRVRNLPERTAINTVIQGSAADLIKKAMLGVHQRIRGGELDARLLLQIHDELVFETPRGQAEDVARVVARDMIEAIPLADVPLLVDVGVGENWLDLAPLEWAQATP